MKLSPIILQLRNSNTTFGDNIAGSAEIANAQDQTFSTDRAFVIQLAENATVNSQSVGIEQRINEIFGVIVALDNRVDKRGQTAHDRLFTIRAEIFSSILNWIPSGVTKPITYAGGKFLKMNRAYFWYQFEFNLVTDITDADGYQIIADDFLHANSKIDIEDDVTPRTDAEDDIFLDGP